MAAACAIIENYLQNLRDSGHLTGNGANVTLSPTVRYSGALVYTAFCVVIYYISSILCHLLIPGYRKITNKNKMYWNLAIVRTVYGTLATVTGAYVRWFDEDMNKGNILENRTITSSFITLMHSGFFLYEVVSQTYFDFKFKTFNKALHLHHVLSFVANFYVIVYNCHHFYCCTMSFLEMSTPFSCLCYVLLQLKMEDTFIWKANQLLLIHIFHLRSVYETYNLYEVYKYWDWFKKIPTSLFIVHMAGLLSIMIILTPLWTYRKTDQFFTRKDFITGDEKKEKDKKN